jgi:hypothetical protein
VTGFELTNERIRVPEYRLEIGPKDDPYLVTGEATLDTGKEQEFLLLADGQQIDVSRIGNAGAAGKTDRDPAISVRQRLEFADRWRSQPTFRSRRCRDGRA